MTHLRGLTRQSRRRIAATLALVGVGLLAAAGMLALVSRADGGDPQLDTASQLQRAGASPPAGESGAQRVPQKAKVPIRMEMPDPVRIVIPAMGVSAQIVPLGLKADRTLQVPDSFSEAGWFRGGPEPGEPGPAVIVGHVDSVDRPGVFYRLRALRSGDVVKVTLKNGWKVRYLVRSHLATPKNDFPTKLVYGHTERPTLRLITCDGQFDTSTGHFVDNYIVFARFDGLHRPH
jgi:sortase (surface protein transpeptidase)